LLGEVRNWTGNFTATQSTRNDTFARIFGLTTLFFRVESGGAVQNKIVIAVLQFIALLILSVTAWGQAEETYKTQCSSCHGTDGSGSTAAGKKLGVPDLRSQQVQGLTDEEMFQTIAHGVKHKQYPHAFINRGLTEKQIADLVVLIRKLPKHP
jgi:cytochrome c553